MTAAVKPVMIMAGGTGGHVYPALAVAQRLNERNVPVIWLGTRKGLEWNIVPQAGIPLACISVSGLRGKSWVTWLLAPMRLALAFFQAAAAIMKHKPRSVLGMGGFVSGPGGVAARLLGVPLVLHEQNAISGLTNRLLAPLSRVLLSGFAGTFASRAAIHVGNPVRADIAAIPAPEQRLVNRRGSLRVLVLGGSQGARALNETVPKALASIPKAERPEVWHQAGSRMFEAARNAYVEAGVDARVDAFIDNMAAAYAWADLVVCRSGALTVAELAAAGVGSVLVPFPHAVDDHQTANAQYLVRAGAAVLIPQTELNAQRLSQAIVDFSRRREQLIPMALAARSLATTDAAERVAQFCLSLGGNTHAANMSVSERRA